MTFLFLKKSNSKEPISLIKKDEIIKNDLAKTYNNLLAVQVEKLDIENLPDNESNLPNVDDLILKAIAKYENHPSISRNKKLNISFEFLDKSKISKGINKLD